MHRDDVKSTTQSAEVAVVWVRRTEPVGHGAITAKQMQGEMLSGGLIDRYLPSTVSEDMVASSQIADSGTTMSDLTGWDPR